MLPVFDCSTAHTSVRRSAILPYAVRKSLEIVPVLPLDRRRFLRLGLSPLGLSVVSGPNEAGLSAWHPKLTRTPGSRNPFTLGVASGEPSDDGFVIWTRLAPDPLNGGGMPPQPAQVGWEVFSDDAGRRLLRRGTAVASPALAHAIHVELSGLAPDRWYWYRFTVGDAVSPIGRARTLPRADAPHARFRFAFASCQHYEQGYFVAHRHLAREDLSLIFHLGDYIYESPARDGRTRRHVGGELFTLDDYRNRYAQYKTDPDLQLAHAACSWIVTWDDHEVADNYAGSKPRTGQPEEGFLLRRAAAYQAYYEHMPLRRRSMARRPGAQMFRGFSCGSLASFFVLDTRQYRTTQPCGDNTTWPCDGMLDPQSTLLGAQQERWLFEGVRASAAPWTILPQQVMVAKVNRRQNGRDRYTMDHWAGYEAERRRLLACLASRPQTNTVVLTGDLHSNWVNDLTVTPEGPPVATELVGTSISSGGDGQDLPRPLEAVLADNPFVRFYNEQRGYVTCDVTPRDVRADYRVVESVSTPETPCYTRASFLIEQRRPGAHRL